jgi:hypothetical protein
LSAPARRTRSCASDPKGPSKGCADLMTEPDDKAIDGVLAALSQGLVSLGEAREAIELIERCRRIMGPPLPGAALSHDIRIQFVTASGSGDRQQ